MMLVSEKDVFSTNTSIFLPQKKHTPTVKILANEFLGPWIQSLAILGLNIAKVANWGLHLPFVKIFQTKIFSKFQNMNV